MAAPECSERSNELRLLSTLASCCYLMLRGTISIPLSLRFCNIPTPENIVVLDLLEHPTLCVVVAVCLLNVCESRPGRKVVFTLNGETGKSVSQYSKQWLQLVPFTKNIIKKNKNLPAKDVLVSNSIACRAGEQQRLDGTSGSITARAAAVRHMNQHDSLIGNSIRLLHLHSNPCRRPPWD